MTVICSKQKALEATALLWWLYFQPPPILFHPNLKFGIRTSKLLRVGVSKLICSPGFCVLFIMFICKSPPLSLRLSFECGAGPPASNFDKPWSEGTASVVVTERDQLLVNQEASRAICILVPPPAWFLLHTFEKSFVKRLYVSPQSFLQKPREVLIGLFGLPNNEEMMLPPWWCTFAMWLWKTETWGGSQGSYAATHTPKDIFQLYFELNSGSTKEGKPCSFTRTWCSQLSSLQHSLLSKKQTDYLTGRWGLAKRP